MRHGLPLINIFDPERTILTLPNPDAYHGLDRYEARDLIVHDLRGRWT